MNWKIAREGMTYGLLAFQVLMWEGTVLVSGQEWRNAPPVEDLERQVQDLEEAGTENSENLESLLKMAELYLDLGYGVYDEPGQKISAFKNGARLARKALNLHEASPRAHFLYAANLGSAAELEGLVASVLILQELKRHVERVLELDHTYAPAHHMLGRLYEELPWFLGGNQEAAGDHLKQAVHFDAAYAAGRLDLARWLIKQGREKEAQEELVMVIERPPVDKKWIWQGKYKPAALRLLRELSDKGLPTISAPFMAE